MSYRIEVKAIPKKTEPQRFVVAGGSFEVR